jgi:WD40 repeat protein
MPPNDPNRTADHVAPSAPSPPPAPDTSQQTPIGANETAESGPPGPPDATGAYQPGAGRGPVPEIPGYEIERELGRGGMGVVYRARQAALNRPVAIKMILGGRYTDALAQARFVVEAEVIARLAHPQIVQVYEFGRCDDQPFFVLEYVGGGSLAGRLAQGRLPAGEAAAVVAKLADGMAAAHQKGVVHRDLKPANVLLTGSGEPKVTDFGLAKIGESDMTASGAVVGTPRYMSPEQAAGKTREVGTPTDVYALGAILYECLTGQPPFRADTAIATIQQVLTADPPRPRAIDPGVPADLETVCLKCLEKAPAKRYATADALAADLRAYLDGRPIAARPVGTAERFVKWVRRRPTLAALLAVTAASLVALPAGGLYFLDKLSFERSEAVTARGAAEAQKREAQDARNMAEAKKQEAEGARNLADAEKKSAQSERDRFAGLLYASQLELALAAWADSDLELAVHHLESTRAELRGWEYHLLRGLFASNQRNYNGHGTPVFAVGVSPDGARFASAGGNNLVKLWDAEKGTELFSLKGHTRPVNSLSFHPKGGQIATASADKTVRVWDAEKGTELFTLPGHTDSVTGVVYSPDGAHLASASWDGTVRVWSVEKRAAVQVLRGHGGYVEGVCFNPDGTRLASAGADRTVRLWAIGADRATHTLKGHAEGAYAVRFHPDGRTLVSGGGSYTKAELFVWDAATGERLRALDGHRQMVRALDFRADGKQLVTGGYDRTVKVWDVDEGRALRTFRGHTHEVLGVCFHRDGTHLLSGAGGRTNVIDRFGEVKLWDATADPGADRRGHRAVTGVAVSPDGTRFASGGINGDLKLWDLAARRGPRTVTALEGTPLAPGSIAAVAFSPDGARVAVGGGNALTPNLPGELVIVDALTGRVLAALPGQKSSVTGVAFHPDGVRLAAASADGTVTLWDTRTAKPIRTVARGALRVTSVSFSPDGSVLLTSSAGALFSRATGEVKLWDAASGNELRAFTGHRFGVGAACLSRDGRRVAAACHDDTVRVWDAETGALRHTLKGHTSMVESVCFTPDGARVISGGADKTVRVWNAETGHQVFVLKGHSGDVAALCLSPDGRSLLAADGEDVWVRRTTPDVPHPAAPK